MGNEESGSLPIFSHVEPVLAVQDIEKTVEYWHHTLGFPSKWTWGQPPNHGGVSWQKIFIQFTHNPALAVASKGNSIWIRVQHIETLYHFHQQKEAAIASPLALQPWGMMEYTVREINGYYIHFAGLAIEREKSESVLPVTVTIIGRKPTGKEYSALGASVGWSLMEEKEAEKRLAAVVFGVVAEDTISGEVIGCALLLGDHASFYYVKDVMVHPHWQGKRVGTALMKGIADWLEKNAANNSLVALIARETLESFYQQFGFAPTFSMIRYMQREESR